MYHMAFIGQYVNAPAGDEIIDNRLLREMICFIGKKYGSAKGSSFSKGKRYIKGKVAGCRSRHIKLMLNTVPNVIVREGVDDKYIFRFSTNSYIEVFKAIVEIMVSNHNSLCNDIAAEYNNIKCEIIAPEMSYSELLIREPLVSLNTVCLHGRNEIVRNRALVLKEGIKKADKKYNL